jgi:phenylacetate-CoA ligase
MSAGAHNAEIGEEMARPSLPQRARLTAAAAAGQWRDQRVAFSSPEATERSQRARLRRIVAHAYERVPYYRETMRRLGLAPGDIVGADDLARLPLIERDQLQRDPDYFTVEGRPASCVATRSGGTTSKPVTVYDDPRGLVERYSATARIRPMVVRLTGKRWRLRIARIHAPMSSGAILGRAYDRSLIKPLDPRVVELDLLMKESVADNLDALNRFRPDIVAATGSYIEELFAHASEGSRLVHRPKVVAYSADPLSRGARAILSEELGIEVLSVYQAIESPPIGFECERHRGHHLNIDLCPVRIVDPDGRDVPPGETGEVVISNLVNRTTVLLNYPLGDLAAEIPERCDCGRNLPLLTFIEGRTAEWLRGADGRRLHEQLLIRPFSLDHEIWGYRVGQRSPGRFEAEVIRAAGSDPVAVSARVRERFASIVGPHESVEIDYVESLPRTAAGKVKRVARVSPPGEGATPGPDSREEPASRGP